MKPIRARRAAAAAAALAVLAAGCGGGGSTDSPSAAADTNTVTIAQFMYDPATVEVPVGTTVTWTNTDEILHTVTNGNVDSPMPQNFDGQLEGLAEDKPTFSFTFNEAGTFRYFCTRHSFMEGEIIVR